MYFRPRRARARRGRPSCHPSPAVSLPPHTILRIPLSLTNTSSLSHAYYQWTRAGLVHAVADHHATRHQRSPCLHRRAHQRHHGQRCAYGRVAPCVHAPPDRRCTPVRLCGCNMDVHVCLCVHLCVYVFVRVCIHGSYVVAGASDYGREPSVPCVSDKRRHENVAIMGRYRLFAEKRYPTTCTLQSTMCAHNLNCDLPQYDFWTHADPVNVLSTGTACC